MAERRRLLVYRLPHGSTLPLSVPFPDQTAPYWKVSRLGKGESIAFRVLSACLASVHIHHYEDRTQLCTKDIENVCEVCKERTRRWQGWLPGRVSKDGRILLFPITFNAARCLPELRDESVDISGRVIELTRGNGSRRDKITAKWLPELHQVLPKEEVISRSEVLAQLCHIWGIRLETERAVNP